MKYKLVSPDAAPSHQSSEEYRGVRSLPHGMRDKVLNAAELIADRGLDGTKMEELASVTGVPKATLYYYFEGKEDILTFLFGEILDAIADAIEGAVATEGTAAERLRAAIIAHLGVIERYPAASRALQFDLGRAARTPHINDRIDAAYRQPLRQLLQDGVDDGSLRELTSPGLAVVTILGAVTTAGVNTIALGSPRTVEEIADGVIDVVMNGVAA